MPASYLQGGGASFTALQKLNTGPRPQPKTRDTYEAERAEAQKRVRSAPPLRKMAAARAQVQATLAQHAKAVEKIQGNQDLTNEAKQRQIAAARDETWRFLGDAVVQEFNEAEEMLRKQHAALPAGLSTNPADLARVQAFGAILPHLTPDAFVEMMQGAIGNRDRAMLGVMIPVAESFSAYKEPYKRVAGELFELVQTARLAVESPETHAASYAAEAADGLRADLGFLLNTLDKEGAIDPLHYEACTRFNALEEPAPSAE